MVLREARMVWRAEAEATVGRAGAEDMPQRPPIRLGVLSCALK
jgi:hypothetical protein